MAWTAVQQSTGSSSGSGSTSITLPAASTKANLLTAVLAEGAGFSGGFSAPAGWVNAGTSVNGTTSRTEVWYYGGNPGGLYATGSPAVFTGTTGINCRGVIQEWSVTGAPPGGSKPDGAPGTATGAAATSLTVSFTLGTSGAVAVGAWGYTASPSMSGVTVTAPSGWTVDSSVSNGTSNVWLGHRVSVTTSGSPSVGLSNSTNMTGWSGIVALFDPLNDTDASNAAVEGVPVTVFVDDAAGFP